MCASCVMTANKGQHKKAPRPIRRSPEAKVGTGAPREVTAENVAEVLREVRPRPLWGGVGGRPPVQKRGK